MTHSSAEGGGLALLIERAVFDAYREGYMRGNEAYNHEYETRVAHAEGNACRYYDERRESLERSFAAALSHAEQVKP